MSTTERVMCVCLVFRVCEWFSIAYFHDLVYVYFALIFNHIIAITSATYAQLIEGKAGTLVYLH
jgi:hypothetical protein